MFLKVTIIIPTYNRVTNEYDYECYHISNLNSPMVQRRLEDIEELDYLKIANLGLLLVREVSYTKAGGLALTCKKVRVYEQEQIKEKVTV